MNNLFTNSVLISMMVILGSCSKSEVSHPGATTSQEQITDKEFNVSAQQWAHDGISKWYTPVFTICPLDDEILELTSYLGKKDIAAILPVASAEASGTFTSVYSTNASQQYTVQFFFFPDNATDTLTTATKFLVHVTR
jgi:hypothetical protein